MDFGSFCGGKEMGLVLRYSGSSYQYRPPHPKDRPMFQRTTPAAAPAATPSTAASSTPLPPLLVALWTILAAHRPAVGQARLFDRLRAVVLGQAGALGRRTITQLLLALGLTDTDPSAFYRLLRPSRLAYDTLTACFFRQTLLEVPERELYVVVTDGVQVPRASRRMPGTAWLKNPRGPAWKPGSHRAQFFGHLAVLLGHSHGYVRALTLRLDPAFPKKAVPGAAAPQSEAQVALTQVQGLRADLDGAGRQRQQLLVVGDSHFDTVDLWNGLPERTLLLVRTACNRVLKDLPPPGCHRNRRYGARVPRPDADLADRRTWERTTLTVRGRRVKLRYRVRGPYLREGASGRPLFLLVVGGMSKVRGNHRRRREPSFWLVNAVQDASGAWVLPLPARELLSWAWQRWEIEVTHRGMKTDWGVGEAQCWGAATTVAAVRLQAWSVAVGVLAGIRVWGFDRHPRTAQGVWWHGGQRWSYRELRQGFSKALAQVGLTGQQAAPRGTWAEVVALFQCLDAASATTEVENGAPRATGVARSPAQAA
jgi:hypothetical protein